MAVTGRTAGLARPSNGEHDAAMWNARVTRHRIAAMVAAGFLVVALAGGSALAVDHSPSPNPTKAPKVKTAEAPITVSGTVVESTDADGDKTYTLTAGGKTYTLEAGPAWWWGANHPLAPHVGKNVEIVGEIAAGSTEIDVDSVNGKPVRATTGKPPWAGGPKTVGERHPGWKSWHAAHPNGKPGKDKGVGHGRASAPGQLKKAAAAAAASASPAP